MLRSLRVRNCLSFLEPVEFTMTVGREERLPHLRIPDPAGGKQILRSAAIYGPNGSGKTNLIECAAGVADFVRDGVVPETLVPFAFSSRGGPLRIEAEFMSGGVWYEHGFMVESGSVSGEWLYRLGPKRMLYRRDDAGVSFGSNLDISPESKRAVRGAAGDRLILGGECGRCEELLSAGSWYRDRVRVFKGYSASCEDMEAVMSHVTCGNGQWLVDLMCAADIKICGVRECGGGIELVHPMVDGDGGVSIPWERESAGTRRIVAFLGALERVARDGALLLVDELDSTIHPFVQRHLINWFHQRALGGGGQLVFTTHACNLMDKEMFRRDQIWFTDKSSGWTELYSLWDFDKVPRGLGGIERWYMEGRFGGVPLLSVQ